MRPAAASSALAIAAVALLACAPARVVGGVRTDEDRWLELQSQHFILATDLDEGEGREEIALLERALAALTNAPLPISPVPDLKMRVVSMADGETLKKLAAHELIGFATEAFSGEPLFVTHAGDMDSQAEVVFHELEHAIQSLVIPRAPRWLLEGLAVYASTLSFEEAGGKPVVAFGAPDQYRADRWRSGKVPDLEAVLSSTWQALSEEEQHAAYAPSWLVVDYLLTRRSAEFFAWLHQLGPVSGKVPTLQQAFPGLSLDELRDVLDSHEKEHSYKKLLFASAPWHGPVTVRKLPPAEVLVLFGRLTRSGPTRTPAEAAVQAQTFALQALALDPTDPEALAFGMGYLPAAERSARVRECAAAHPADWRCPLLEAILPGATPAEQLHRCERAARLGPDVPLVLAALATTLVKAQKPERAAVLALTALRSSPANPAFLDTLAQARAGQGRCAEARELETRAQQLASLHGSGKQLGENRRVLDSCVEGKPWHAPAPTPAPAPATVDARP